MSLHSKSPDALLAEAERILTICNLCNYCNGFCDVFRAAEQRRTFALGDVEHLAHLCHNCRNCRDACQYAAPHPLDVHLPKVMSALRQESYVRHGGALRVFARPGWHSLILTIVLMVMGPLLVTQLLPFGRWGEAQPGFYDVIGWGWLASIAAGGAAWAVVGLLVGSVRYWRSCRSSIQACRSVWAALPVMLRDVATLRNLGGSIEPGQYPGCNDVDDRLSSWRRWFHHGLFYGFMLCLTSTAVATFYHHLLQETAPYPWLSAPVVLGMLGGLAMLGGALGLMVLKKQSDPTFHQSEIKAGEYGLLAILALVAASGLCLLALRETVAMPLLLASHLGCVMGLFVTLPYGKFMHAPYRAIALLHAAMERQNPLKESKE